MIKYKIKIQNPVLGVPVTFIEHYTPPDKIGGGFGSELSDSEKEQTAKTSMQTGGIITYDTLSLLNHRNDLYNEVGGGTTYILPTPTHLLIRLLMR